MNAPTTTTTDTNPQADPAAELREEITAAIEDGIGMRAPLSGYMADVIVDRLRQRRPGTRLWVPAAQTAAERAASILSAARGNNLREVARAHGVHVSTVYRVIGAQGKRRAPQVG